jgi:hypothetical protein
MLLSKADIERLEEVGYDRQGFVRYGKEGFAKLRNRRDYCVFYDVEKRRCKVYRHRPLGCRIYPVIYSEEIGVIVDEVCPMKDTVTEVELKKKGREVVELLKRIDTEQKMRLLHEQSQQS